MSLVDDTLGPIPGPLIAKWGQPAVFVQQTVQHVYDPVPLEWSRPPQTTYQRSNWRYSSIDVMTEDGGLYQASDVKVMIDPGQIGGASRGIADVWPTTADRAWYARQA